MVDFAAMLKTKAVDVTPPPTLPVGTYRTRVGTYKTVSKTINGEDKGIFSFNLTILEPLTDVDEDAIKEYGGLDKLKNHKLKHDVFVGDDGNLSQVKRFAEEVCKVEVSEDMEMLEVIAGTQGATVLVAIQHKPRGNGKDGVFAVISNVLPDEE